MDFHLDRRAGRLRSELRALIAEHVPPDYLGAFSDDDRDQAVANEFCRILAEQGLLALAWPSAYGGRDGSVWEQTVVREEMWAHHEPRGAQYMGINWVGPAIMAFGTGEQRLRHLPDIAAGKTIWCQGFSEPEAGSDLASLQTRARADGTGWSITGQKVWTSYAQLADWCFLAARTGSVADRREGISIFLVPMGRPGIEVRPIASMLGPHHLNEVFFQDLRVEGDELLGREGGGWEVINAALTHERVGIARYARADRLLANALHRLKGDPSALPGGLAARFARALVETRVARLLAYDAIDAQARGGVDLAQAAAARIAMTINEQSVAEVLAEIVGPRFLDGPHDDEVPPFQAEVEDFWRYARAATVAAGTVEIQRTLVARAVLGDR